MGSGKGGSAPAPPDPALTAAAQGAANKDAALASLETSMIGQNTPFGSLTYTKTGTSESGNPQYTATTTLSPEQQQLLNLQNQGSLNLGNLGIAQLGRINDAVAQPFDMAQFGAAPTLDNTYIQNAKNSIIARDAPRMDQARQALITSLANQGITDPGSQAYMSAIDELNRSQNDFSLGADRAAFNEAAAKYGIDTSGRQQAIQEAAYARQLPLSEYAAFMGQAAPQQPTFTPTPQYQQAPADITGPTYANYQGQLGAYNANQQANAATAGGLFGLGGGLGAAGILKYSDRRLKKNIRKCGTLANGLTEYEFEYLWGEKSRGVMADEVLAVRPDAVVMVGGFMAVDYSKLDS